MIIPVAILLGYLLVQRRRAPLGVAVPALGLAGVLLACLYFTYSRAPLIGLFVVVVVVCGESAARRARRSWWQGPLPERFLPGSSSLSGTSP